MTIKSNKEISFGAFIDRGIPKEEIMKHFDLKESEYEKVYNSLMELRQRMKEKEKDGHCNVKNKRRRK